VLVSQDKLLSIGSFGLLTGLSVTTLRHYDDADVLEPAFVDPERATATTTRTRSALGG
jgi:hypothetical protein